MKVFITGGHGFLGRHIVAELRDFNARHAADGEKPPIAIVAPTREECNLIQLYSPKLQALVEGCDVVIHAAARVGGLGFVNQNRLDLMWQNLQMSLSVLRAAKNAGTVKVFVSIGSACSYPLVFVDGKQHEDDFWAGPCDPSVEAYGGYKRTLEMLARQEPSWHALHLPLANLYGPGDGNLGERAHVLTALIEKVVRAKREGAASIEAWAPDTEREFMFVEDAAEAIVAIVLRAYRGGVPYNILNIGTGQCHRIDEVMRLIQEAAGVEIPVTWNPSAPRGVQRKVLDVERLHGVVQMSAVDVDPDGAIVLRTEITGRGDLGLFPPISLEDGIQKTVAAYEALR